MIVRDYVRNYRTNQEIVKIKEKNGDVKGIATVQLFDAKTGALELEAKTHNIIYQAVYDWLKSYQWDKFCTGAYNKTNTYGGYWEMDNIYLVTSSAPENERVNIFNYNTTANGNPGQQIGWANKNTYSGSDTQRGSPNSSESYANDTRIHWVFDWPTHAANGTFQTIIWANTLNPYGKTVLVASTGINNGTYTSGFGAAYDGSYIYALSWDGKLYKLTTAGQVVGSAVSTGISAGSEDGFGLTYADGYLYAINRDGALYKLTTAGSVIGSAVSTGIYSGSSFSANSLAYDGTYLYALKQNGDLYKLTTSGQIVGSAVSTGASAVTGSGSAFGLVCVGGILYAINAYGTLYRITTSGQIVGAGASTGINTSEHSQFGFTSDGSNFYALSYDGNLYNVNITDHYFARTLLPSPITKTNQNTMKVIYDFIRG